MQRNPCLAGIGTHAFNGRQMAIASSPVLAQARLKYSVNLAASVASKRVFSTATAVVSTRGEHLLSQNMERFLYVSMTDHRTIHILSC